MTAATTRQKLVALIRERPEGSVREYARLLRVSVARTHALLRLLGARKLWTLPGGPRS